MEIVAYGTAVKYEWSNIENILSDETIKKIQLYMKNGGLILFDTRDQSPNNIISNNISQEQIYLKRNPKYPRHRG